MSSGAFPVKSTTFFYLGGMATFFLGERMVGGEDPLRWALDCGGVGILVALVYLWRDMVKAKDEPGQALSHRVSFIYALIGAFSLVLYSLTTEWGLDLMGHDLLSGVTEEAEAAERYKTVMTCLWMVVWMIGTLPFLAADWVLHRNPMAVDPSSTRSASTSALTAALLISALFPLNYWTSQQDPASWVEDHSYFKAPVPGDQAKMLVSNLDQPVTIYAFFPEADVVRDQVERYLMELEGGLLGIEVIDQALEPTLSEDLKVRDNGWLAFVRGEGDDRQIERVKLGLAKKRRDLDSNTRKKIKTLDQEVLQQLRKISSSKRTIYVTSGHGELHWGAQTQGLLDRVSTLKKMVSGYNYQIQSLGLSDGLNEQVPDDAAMVLVLGPTQAFLDAEIASLHAYREAGGSLLLALRPALQSTPDLSGLLSPLGLAYDGNQVLAHSNAYAQLTGGPQDQFLIYTKSYTTHSSVSLLHKQKEISRELFMPISGVLTETGEGDSKPQVAIKSMAETWGETTRQARFDADVETKQIYNLAYAVSGVVEGAEPEVEGDEAPEWRVFVTSSANWISDPLITGAKGEADPRLGNAQLVADLLGWLGHDASAQESVNNEEDRKVQHTKGAAGWIFYGTTFIIPFVFFFLGLARLSIRRRGGAA